ncbi:hypothetical protein J3S85_37645 [Streptomyces lavenduligriseus]|nr:hypothetical protein J3S85_37645 [Streptomyces lavenduligriseus]
MIEYRLNCDADPTDYLTVDKDGGDLEFFAHRGGGSFLVSIYPTVDAARTFARGILALADEIDGGEAKEEPKPAAVRVGDRFTVTRSFLEWAHVRAGDVVTVVEFVDDDSGDFRAVIEGGSSHRWLFGPENIGNGLEPLGTRVTADEPATVTDPRLTYFHQAEAALAEFEHTAADIIALARFLAGE